MMETLFNIARGRAPALIMLVAMALPLSCRTPGLAPAESIEAMTISGVQIRTESDVRIFPSHWRLPHIDARADPIGVDALERSLPILRAALEKYPPKLLDGQLDAVYLIGRLTFFGVRAAGTSSTSNVYLAVRSEQEGFTAPFVEGVFHHELSSIFLRNFADSFPHERWYGLLPEGFVYLSSIRAIRLGRDAQRLDERYLHDGFINQYAMASVEEDFNAIAQNLFLGDPAFWDAVDRFDTVRDKVRLVIDFYSDVHPAFTEAYFRGLTASRDAF